MPARDAADCLIGLRGLFDKADLLVVTPSPPAFGAQHINLHSPRDLKARLRQILGRLSKYTRRPPEGCGQLHEGELAGAIDCGVEVALAFGGLKLADVDVEIAD
ncbi:hypothetical protein QMZ05_20420 [Bradyrhizobium sp. INPA03-11B]